MWIAWALGSAVVTALIGTLTKAGLEKVDSGVALAIQATVLIVLAWGTLVFQGKVGELGHIERKAWMYLIGAGVTMMLGYVFYFRALASGPSSAAQPIDRLSLVFAIIFAAFLLKEKITPTMIVGCVLMSIGAIIIAIGSPKG